MTSVEPKRLSKRKGAPKHIIPTLNHQKRPTSSVQLIVKFPSADHDDDDGDDNDDEEMEEEDGARKSGPSQYLSSTKRISSRRKPEIIMENSNQKKKFKQSTKDSELSVRDSRYLDAIISKLLFRSLHLIYRIINLIIVLIFSNRTLQLIHRVIIFLCLI